MERPVLSICIATYNRGSFIGETLESIVSQLGGDVELLVFDGASPDDTEAVVRGFQERCPQLRYRRAAVNSGVDADYDNAVLNARGRYCWLMTDDDLLAQGAVAAVLEELAHEPSLLVVNAEVRTADLGHCLQARLLPVESDRHYSAHQMQRFFEEIAAHLKFIGAVVIEREEWLKRDRRTYFGSLFVHVGVIFQQPPLAAVRVLARPVLVLRYGNAMWTARSFEIWMFKWPGLVWSFKGFPDVAKRRVAAREPWRRIARLGSQRALGAYSMAQFGERFAGLPRCERLVPHLIARIPLTIANALAAVACIFMPQKARLNLYDLARVPHATRLSRVVARWLQVLP